MHYLHTTFTVSPQVTPQVSPQVKTAKNPLLQPLTTFPQPIKVHPTRIRKRSPQPLAFFAISIFVGKVAPAIWPGGEA